MPSPSPPSPPPTTTSLKTAPKSQRTLWLHPIELFLRSLVLFTSTAALILPIIITVTLHHQLTLSYAAVCPLSQFPLPSPLSLTSTQAIYTLLLNTISLSLLLFSKDHRRNPRSCCTGVLDFLGIPLAALGGIGAGVDGSGTSVRDAGGVLHWVEVGILGGIV